MIAEFGPRPNYATMYDVGAIVDGGGQPAKQTENVMPGQKTDKWIEFRFLLWIRALLRY